VTPESKQQEGGQPAGRWATSWPMGWPLRLFASWNAATSLHRRLAPSWQRMGRCAPDARARCQTSCLLPPASCLLPPASCLLPPASCLLPPAVHYERRRPEESVLYQTLARHLESFVSDVERDGERVLPYFVERELRDFLGCGILARGFLRVRCPQCRYDRVVAFSCKRRGFCPSCGGAWSWPIDGIQPTRELRLGTAVERGTGSCRSPCRGKARRGRRLSLEGGDVGWHGCRGRLGAVGV